MAISFLAFCNCSTTGQTFRKVMELKLLQLMTFIIACRKIDKNNTNDFRVSRQYEMAEFELQIETIIIMVNMNCRFPQNDGNFWRCWQNFEKPRFLHDAICHATVDRSAVTQYIVSLKCEIYPSRMHRGGSLKRHNAGFPVSGNFDIRNIKCVIKGI